MNSQQAIDLLKGLGQSLDDYCELNDERKAAFRMAITALELFGISEQLPAAQPDHLCEVAKMMERKTGRWIELTNTNHTYVCSVCGRMLINITDGKNTVTKNYPFCHCGAAMTEEEQDGN